MRPYRSIIFSRINRINRMNRIIKQDKRIRIYDSIALIAGATVAAICIALVLSIASISIMAMLARAM
ncbi:hypothetical protein LCGC14_1697390 [marine sediment metagenome]|uniref:Uncharacterized protein n=1 Tax=marine sediment metagenome TaxID=412755 RepID=A0A0F9KJ09_9ZZZZ